MIDGQKKFRGKLLSANDSEIVIETIDNDEVAIEYGNIKRAKLDIL